MKLYKSPSSVFILVTIAIVLSNTGIVNAMYDPHLGQFTSRDPVAGKFKEPLTLHKYLYCINDPINSVDPAGEWAISRGLGISVSLGTALPNVFNAQFGRISISIGQVFGLTDDLEFFGGTFFKISFQIAPTLSIGPNKKDRKPLAYFVGIHNQYHEDLNSIEEFMGNERGVVPQKSRIPNSYFSYQGKGPGLEFGLPGGVRFNPFDFRSPKQVIKTKKGKNFLTQFLKFHIRGNIKGGTFTWVNSPVTIGPVSSKYRSMPY